MTQCDPALEGWGVYIPLRLPLVNHLATLLPAKEQGGISCSANPSGAALARELATGWVREKPGLGGLSVGKSQVNKYYCDSK